MISSISGCDVNAELKKSFFFISGSQLAELVILHKFPYARFTGFT